MELELFPANPNKLLESKYIEKFINIIDIPLNVIINYHINSNINNDVLYSYNLKPDILIINFSTTTPNKLKNIPRYPIFVNNVFYITPICYQQINGFSNDINNMDFLINDFIERIKRILGAIISTPNFTFNTISQINLNSGIKNIMFPNSISNNWFVNHVPSWTTKFICSNKAGWLSSFNKIAIDYVFSNYDISSIAELGAYYGLSTKYMANIKSNDSSIYSFDQFDNIMLTNYVAKNITPLDLNYFFKYIKLESFHSNLSSFNNIFSLKYDCFNAPELLHNNKINIDLFYIDFCKKDKLLINFVNKIFKFFPNSIIIGDDASMLSSSLEHFKNNYNYVFLTDCYICSKNIIFKNSEQLLLKYNNEIKYRTTTNIELLETIDINYKIYFISRLIDQQKPYNEIFKALKTLNIDPNAQCSLLRQNSNLFHHIAYKSTINNKYYLGLYNYLNNKYIIKNTKNNFNLTPNDYFNYELNSFI